MDRPAGPVEAVTPPIEPGHVLPEPTQEAAYVELKQQLHALDYRQTLGLDSAPLVRRLLDDLLLTTNEYETLRLAKEDVERELAAALNGRRPLETENARLLRENNEVRMRGLPVPRFSAPMTAEYEPSPLALLLQLHRELIEHTEAGHGEKKKATIELGQLREQVEALKHAQQQHLQLIAAQVSRVQP